MKIIYPFTHSFLDYPSPFGSCLSIYTIGCSHNCKDCSSPLLQDFNYSSENTIYTSNKFLFDLVLKDIKSLPYKQVCFMGGDPCHPNNIEDLQRVINLLIKTKIAIMVYTGHEIDYIKHRNLKGFTYLKCGTYNKDLKIESEKTDDYIQFASTNQKLYDKDYNLISENGRYYFK